MSRRFRMSRRFSKSSFHYFSSFSCRHCLESSFLQVFIPQCRVSASSLHFTRVITLSLHFTVSHIQEYVSSFECVSSFQCVSSFECVSSFSSVLTHIQESATHDESTLTEPMHNSHSARNRSPRVSSPVASRRARPSNAKGEFVALDFAKMVLHFMVYVAVPYLVFRTFMEAVDSLNASRFTQSLTQHLRLSLLEDGGTSLVTHLHKHTFTRARVRAYAHANVRAHTHIHSHVHARVCAHIQTHTHTHNHTYTHYTHKHTHTHTGDGSGIQPHHQHTCGLTWRRHQKVL